MMGVRIDPLTMAETVAATEQFVRDKKPLHLMGVNADKLNQCATDEAIKKIVNGSEIINADGASVVLAARYLGYAVPERVAGIDLMQELRTMRSLWPSVDMRPVRSRVKRISFVFERLVFVVRPCHPLLLSVF